MNARTPDQPLRKRQLECTTAGNDMATLTFENLDFSLMIDVDNKTAYLQEWDEGNWGPAEQHTLPLALESFPKKSRLSRAVKSFRPSDEHAALSSALEHGLVREPAPEPRTVWRGLATRIAQLIYA